MQGAYPVKPGDRVLVVGTGGVALLAVQLAHALGAIVCVVSRSEEKLTRVREMGVEYRINSSKIPSWGTEVFQLTGGVDKVVDTVGMGTLDQSLAALMAGGEVALVGLFAQVGSPLGLALFGKSVRGITGGSALMYEQLAGIVDNHNIAPKIDREFEFHEVKQALSAQSEFDKLGKIAIHVNPK